MAADDHLRAVGPPEAEREKTNQKGTQRSQLVLTEMFARSGAVQHISMLAERLRKN